MEVIISRGNMMAAYNRVMRNKGASGVDDMPVTALKGYLQGEWPRIREELLAGKYRPQPVRKVEIPKPGGGMRMLGIPTVLDRLIQQAVHQVLSQKFDPDFSASSYGFRPGKSAHQAVEHSGLGSDQDNMLIRLYYLAEKDRNTLLEQHFYRQK